MYDKDNNGTGMWMNPPDELSKGCDDVTKMSREYENYVIISMIYLLMNSVPFCLSSTKILI